ncbi:hypothetical protein [Staphylococcus sp. Marseille-Q1834]|uniref:hypothetical protein n=1 Tax=Staphylococcus sp. Marseille-Q1834 TaxID=2866594 RepID=UPI0012B6C5C1|nr:hypothetical protein [Staphylococcus sp. Marseille-Q1834]
MKILKQRKTLMLISCLILIIFVTACGKEDKASNELVGNTYKAIKKGKVEANFTFEKDGSLKMVSADGKPNAGEEARANYEIVDENNNKYLIVHNEPKDFFSVKDGFDTASYEQNNDFYNISLIKFKEGKVFLKKLELKNKSYDTQNLDSKKDIKYLKEFSPSVNVFELELVSKR